MTTTTVDLQIIPLHNCTRCIRKVEKTLCRFDGVKLLDVDSENGKFTIQTTRHPEEIRDALQRKFSGKSVILSKRINHLDPLSALINPRNSSIEGPLNLHDLAEALVTVSHANGLQTVEITQSNTINFTFGNQPTTSASATNVPPPPPPPPPPPLPQYQPTTSGSARRPENIWDSEDGGHGYVNVPPPPPPPPQFQGTTSGSAWEDENVWGYGGARNEDDWGYGGARNEDFGYGYAPPPPPRTTTEPSAAPLFPRAQVQGYVYGYPIELYRDDDYSCGCCTIL